MCIQSAYKEIGDAEMKKSIGFIIPFEIKKQYENIFFFFLLLGSWRWLSFNTILSHQKLQRYSFEEF